MPKLTKRLIEAIVHDPTRPVYVWDDQLVGFGLKALSGGAKRYIVKYRSGAGGRSAPQRWLTLGSHGAVTCDQARDLARQALAAVARGEDPQQEKRAGRQAPTMTDLWSRFETEQIPLKKGTTARDYRQRWRDILQPALGLRKVDDVGRADIDRLHKHLRSTPYQANRTLALLSRLFNLAEAWGWREPGSNPCRLVEKFKEEARSRYLSAGEIERLGRALERLTATGALLPQAAAAIRLLLLTGARLGEILGARWDWVNSERRLITLPDSKTGKKTIFLSEASRAILAGLEARGDGSPFLIPGRVSGRPLNNLSKSWRRVLKVADLEGVRLHDLRHTAASIAVGRGATLPLIGRLLGHSQAQTTNRYAHVDADPAIALANDIGRAIGSSLGVASAVRGVSSVDDPR